jgi:hypothetical protein
MVSVMVGAYTKRVGRVVGVNRGILNIISPLAG